MGRLIKDIFEDGVFHFTPNMINRELMPQMFKGVRDKVKWYGMQLLIDGGWKFYVVNQRRGRCYYASKVITIPAWVFRRPIDYKEWYLSHEMAHALDKENGTKSDHGPLFMYFLKCICPEDCVHYEIEYKPRNAVAAGIRKPDTDTDDLSDLFE